MHRKGMLHHKSLTCTKSRRSTSLPGMTDRLATISDLLDLWRRQNWDDGAWVAELRSAADPLRRAGYGEDWWAAFQPRADRWWEKDRVHMQHIISHGGGDRRLRDLTFTLAARYAGRS